MKFAPLALAVLLSSTAAVAAEAPPPEDDGAFVQGEKTVETRLLAPCCWNGTLDTHESDLARDMRREIRARLRGGESVDAIEASMIERYGDKIRATPANEHVGLLLGAGVLGVLAMAAVLLRRSVGQMKPATAAPVVTSSATADEWDKRLDQELERRRERLHA